MPLDPKDRPPLQLEGLVDVLARHKVEWVLVGSQVLALHGAELTPNDLDVVPRVTDDNLDRVARCLEQLDAVAAYLDGWGGARGTLEACRAWRPRPATAENLDWLMVTPLGMLDIVIEFATEPYAVVASDALLLDIGGHTVSVCDPRRVLRALEPRQRSKDAQRRQVYNAMRQKFGMDHGTTDPK